MADEDKEPVRVVAYDPRWPALYEQERALLAETLGDLLAGIEHVGSTAVPGLGAKPVIDIMVGLRALADGDKCIRPLEALGYEYLGEYGIPGRLYFRKQALGARTHQIHMVQHMSDFWERHLLFRDYLRTHPEMAQAYYELKVRLAGQLETDREGYTEAKTDFIRSVEARARAALSGRP